MKEKTNHRFYTMSKSIQFCSGFILVLIFSVAAFSQGKSYQSQTAEVNGVKIHYLKEGAMRAAFEYFKAFNKQDAEDNRKFAAHKLPIPVLVIAGDKAMGDAIEVQAKIVADNVTAIKFADTGHWLMEERPAETGAALRRVFEPAVQANQR